MLSVEKFVVGCGRLLCSGFKEFSVGVSSVGVFKVGISSCSVIGFKVEVGGGFCGSCGVGVEEISIGCGSFIVEVISSCFCGVKIIFIIFKEIVICSGRLCGGVFKYVSGCCCRFSIEEIVVVKVIGIGSWSSCCCFEFFVCFIVIK